MNKLANLWQEWNNKKSLGIKKDSTSQYNVGYVNQDLLKYISRRILREEKEEQDWKEGGRMEG